MNIDFAPFVESMNLTFHDMAGIEIANGPFEEQVDAEALADISVSIGLTGQVKASVLLTTSSRLAIIIAEKVTGMDNLKVGDRIVTDAMGEMLNMIVGAAQRHSNVKFDFALPVAVEGSSHMVHPSPGVGYRRVVSKMEGGDISLYLFESGNSNN